MTSTILSNKTQNGFGAIFKWSLQRSVSIIAVYSSILLLVLPVVLLCFSANNGVFYYIFDTNYNNFEKLHKAFSMLYSFPVPLITVVFSIIVAVNMFNIFHNKRSMDLFASLPAKRTTLFFSRYVLGLAILLIPLLIISVLAGTLFISDIGYILARVGMLSVSIIAGYTMFALMAVCCGTIVDTVISYIAINFAYPCCYFVIKFLIITTLPGLGNQLNYFAGIDNGSTVAISLLSPIFGNFFCGSCILSIEENINTFTGLPNFVEHLIYWLVFSAIVIVVTFILAKKRKNENVQMGFIFILPKIIITIASSVGCGLLVGFIGMALFLNGKGVTLSWFTIWGILGTFIAFLVITLIYNRGGKGFVKALPVFAVSVLLVLGISLSIDADIFGISHNVPNVEEVESVKVSQPFPVSLYACESDVYNEYGVWYKDGNKAKRLTGFSTDKEVIENTVKLHKTIIDNIKNQNLSKKTAEHNIEIVYKLKNGSTIKRFYNSDYYDVDIVNPQLQNIVNSEEYKKSNYVLANYSDSMQINIEINNMHRDIESITSDYSVVDEENTNNVIDKKIAKEFAEALHKDFMEDNDVLRLSSSFESEDAYEYCVDLTVEGSIDKKYGYDFKADGHIGNNYDDTDLQYNVISSEDVWADEVPQIYTTLYIPKDGYKNTKNVIKKYSFGKYDSVTMETY